MKQKFDYIISLGENCQTAMTLRYLNLRNAAFPFDWHGVRDFAIAGEGGFSKKIDIICNNFENFFNLDNYEEFFEKWETGHRLVVNKQTGLQFLHEFPKSISIEEHFPTFEKKYQKRIDRLYSVLNSESSVLFVFIEFFSRLTDEEINNTYIKFIKHFPKANINLLIIKNNIDLNKEKIVQRDIVPNIHICEINNDFSSDHIQGLGNIGNKSLYERIIWNYGTLGYIDSEFYNNINDFKDRVLKNFDYLGWKVNEIIPKKIDQLSAKMPEQIKYANGWEKDFVKKHFCEFDLAKNKDDIQALLSGLDQTSAYNVQLVLSRMVSLIRHNYDDIDIFSSEEQKEIRDVAKQRDNVLFLDKDLFYHKGCYLPINHFENLLFEQNLNIALFPQNVLSEVAGKCIIDVGAYIGDSAFILNQLKPKEIYAFEANPQNCNLLKKTLELNHMKNIIIENIALGDKINASIKITDDEACSHIVNDVSLKTVTIDCHMSTLDDYILGHPEINVGLIKVDIEGMEQKFLKGAIETIRKFKPVLILSIYHNWSDFLHIKNQLDVLNLGYKFMISKPTSGAIILETELLAYPE